MKCLTFLMMFFLCGCCLSLSQKETVTGIKGVVVNEEDKPVSDAYAYLYRSLSSRLIGPADFMEKSDEKGNFFFDVPEGKYYLVIRKRAQGGDAGPLKQGDRAVNYTLNPVIVKPGILSEVKVVLPEKKSFYFKRMPMGDWQINLVIKTEVRKKLMVLIHEGDVVKKSPDYIVEMEGKNVTFPLQKGKKYFLVIREELREKVLPGEFYAEYGPFLPEETGNNIYIELKK